MIRVFADTFYYLALLNSVDDAHANATEFTADYSGEMVTTDWVLSELADGLAGKRTRKAVIEFIESLQTDRAVRIVPAGRKLFERRWELFCRRRDKAWPLTGCISFIVMKDRGMTDALTGDRHFEQAGFRVLLK